MMQFKAPKLKVVPTRTKAKKSLSARTVLEERFVLLEDYGPVWYTKRHHDRVVRALGETAINRPIASRGREKNLARAASG